ncbi:MAG: S-layer homology domain-containing protein [Clostridia bacterium]|nr:S-layer homology domain-containing protein [Clostridia bacterium]
MRMKIQKWICTLITVIMLFSIGVFNVTAAETADSVSTYDKAFDLLSYLGIYDSDMEIDRMDKEKTISRGEFAFRFARLINVADLSAQTLYYIDVPASHYAYKEITNLTDLGYLSGIGDKKFAPEESMQQTDAAKLLLKGLGLLDIINGDYTNERFISDTMRETGISITGKYMTFGQMTLMMYNALLADCYSPSDVIGNNFTYNRREGDSLLYKTRHMRYIKDKLMTAANGTNIYGKASGKKEVVINDVTYYTEDGDFSEFLGRYVDFVYSEDDGYELVWAILSGKDEKLIVTVGKEGGYDAEKRQVWYIKNGGNRYAKISASATVVYNGRPIYNDIAQVLSVPDTRLTLLSSQKNGNYDIILAQSHVNIQVRSMDNEKYIVRDTVSGESISLEENEYDRLLIEDLNGNEITWSDIQEYNILSIFKTKDGGYARVVVSNNMINGTVDSVKGDGTVVIGDSSYKLYGDGVKSRIVLGTSGTYYLDCFGYIAAVNASAKSENKFVGFALRGVCDNEEYPELVLRILSENGTIEKYVVKDKLNINGNQFKNMEAAMKALSENGIFKPQIMLCQKNENGDLVRIDTASPDDGGVHPLIINRELKKDLGSIEQAMYNPYQKSIGLTMLTNSDTVVFSVPEIIGSDFSKCFVATLRQWDDYRGAVSYRTTLDDTFYEEYIVTRQITYASTAQNHPLVMVDEIMKVYDKEEGEAVTRMVVARAGKLQEFTVDKNCNIESYNLKRGDVVRLATTASNNSKVELVSVVSRVGDTTPVGSSLRETPYSVRTISCYAHDKKGNALKVGWDSGEDFDEIIQLSDTTPIAVYDSESDRVYYGTIDDIDTYESDDTPSKLIVQSDKGQLQYIMVQR